MYKNKQMYKDYKIVIVTPAGRKRYLELLIPYILKLRPLVDEYRLFMNTGIQEDIDYMVSLEKQYESFIKLQYLPSRKHLQLGAAIASFLKNCTDEHTIYLRLDDDIIYLDDLPHFQAFLDFRIEHPEYFLVYLNILNNGITSYIHQRFGHVDTKEGIVNYDATDKIGWESPTFANYLHEEILRKGIDAFRFNQPWILYNHELVSVNAICWFGSEFAKFNGEVNPDEERWLSVIKPQQIHRYNCIYGNCVCVHFSFWTQRTLLDTTDLLERYKHKQIQDPSLIESNPIQL